MNSIRTLNILSYPFLTWSRLAWNLGQMAMSSAEVIARRSTRMALAGANPGAEDRREFALMTREKQDAAWESFQGAGLPMFGLYQQVGLTAYRQFWTSALSAMSIASSRTPAQLIARQSQAATGAVKDTAIAASKLSGSSAKIVRRALKPVHSRVKDNVKRLRKGK